MSHVHLASYLINVGAGMLWSTCRNGTVLGGGKHLVHAGIERGSHDFISQDLPLFCV